MIESGFARPVQRLGRGSLRAVEDLGRAGLFAARILGCTLRPPLRARRWVSEVFDLGALSVLLVAGAGLAVGMVLSLQGYNTLVRFGAEAQLGAVVGLSLIRELGPVLTALLVTGRAGSAVTAEIGTMVATEQLDGLRMMSIDPVDWVVAPKAQAMTFVMPLLSALFILSALAGGYLVGVRLLGVDPGAYVTSLETSVDFRADVAGSLLKALLFGALVALVATWRGYTSEPSSAGVSAATTRSVVTASVGILVADYLFTALWGV